MLTASNKRLEPTRLAPPVYSCAARRAAQAQRSAQAPVGAFTAITMAILMATSLSVASEPLPASHVKWSGRFGESRADTNTLFCLMAHGYLRSETTNVQVVVDAWLKDHPKALVITVVSGGPVTSRLPHSKQAFVWIVQGPENLNVEVVRHGYFCTRDPNADGWRKAPSPARGLRRLPSKIIAAGKQARTQGTGLWRSSPK